MHSNIYIYCSHYLTYLNQHTMRILSIILFILWLIFGWWLYNDPRDCCEQGSVAEVKKEIVQIAKTPVKAVGKAVSPLLFNQSSGNTILGSNWSHYRDSIINTLKPDKILEITGHYRSDEKNTSKFKNLGLFRANETAKLFYKHYPKDKIRLLGKLVSGKSATNPFVSASFRGLMDSKNIKEVAGSTLIYFPFNSTSKLNNREVESYLDDVAAQVKKNNQKISLVGHTDNIGEDASNYNLGLRRANIVKDYLIKRGVVPSKILASSKGEKSPIASNDTDAGRAKNRRTELKIIK